MSESLCHCGKPKSEEDPECLNCDKIREEIAAERWRETNEGE